MITFLRKSKMSLDKQNLKRLILLIFISSLFTILSPGCSSSQEPAQEPIGNQGKSEKIDQRKAERQQLLADLNLTQEHELEVETILKDSQEQLQALRNSGGDRRIKFQQMREIGQGTDQKLKTILDDGQYKIYENFKEKQKEQMRQQMGNRRGGRTNP
ncbi:hypothetical protein [Psychroflexus tropicus]|uniref:hypothetical protein n=1 Tax=Psychroflexus tropicus TaxID=197345 RepID=UPI00037516C1|nr:hypothetical protein [Psychroflexus tropicus]